MKPVLILHLSDLHFGSYSRFSELDPVDVASRFTDATREERQRRSLTQDIDLVIVSGDVAETGLPKEYEQAKTFFLQLAAELELDPRRFVFTPGNHDVSWIQCKRAVLDLEEQDQGKDEQALRKIMDATKFNSFEKFIEDFQGPRFIEDSPGISKPSNGVLLDKHAFVYDFSRLNISCVAMNSCERESHRKADHLGEISKEQAQAVMNLWREDQYRTFIKIIVIHHPPVENVPANVKSWVEYLESVHNEGKLEPSIFERFAADAVGLNGRELLHALAEDNQVQLVLHGHHHAIGRQPLTWSRGQKGATHVLSAGSWGLNPEKLPREQDNAGQLILLDPDAKEIRAWLMIYSPRARGRGFVTPGKFVSDPATPKGYVQELYLADLEGSSRVDTSTDETEGLIPFPRDNRQVIPVRKRLPDERPALTHKFSLAGYEGYLHVGLSPTPACRARSSSPWPSRARP